MKAFIRVMIMNEKKIVKSAIAILPMFIIIFYISCLKEYGGEYLSWTDYVRELGIAIVFGAISLFVAKPMYGKSPLLATAFIALVSVASIAIMTIVLPGDSLHYAEMLTLSLCPLLWYGLSVAIDRITKQCPVIVGFAMFNLIIVLFIFLTEEVLFRHPLFSADTPAEVYMYVSGIITFVLYSVVERKRVFCVRDTLLACLIVFVVVSLWMIFQERIASIIGSLSFDKNAVDSEGEYLNWISHRRAMADAFFKGDFSPVNPHRIASAIKGCPVAQISAEGGGHVFPSLLCLYLAFSVLGVIYATNCRKALVTALALCFVLKIIIGTFANIFLIFSTSVGFPFIRSAFDVIPIGVMLLFSGEKRND